MGTIIAIGGGELRDAETRAIDAYIVERTGKSRPHALFIPTASGDASGYTDTFHTQYGDQLGCTTDVLYLLQQRPASDAIADKIAAADLIYVGGGNTLRMMKLWRRLGVDVLLNQAHERGTVLSGLSAGAICWFAGGHSDSRRFAKEDGDDWGYIRVSGLGLVDALYCPHIDAEDRLPHFQAFMAKRGGVGIGCDDCCAIEVTDHQWQLITSRHGAKAYRVTRQRGQVMTDILQPDPHYRPLADLLAH